MKCSILNQGGVKNIEIGFSESQTGLKALKKWFKLAVNDFYFILKFFFR
jgi:hypothetical protein